MNQKKIKIWSSVSVIAAVLSISTSCVFGQVDVKKLMNSWYENELQQMTELFNQSVEKQSKEYSLQLVQEMRMQIENSIAEVESYAILEYEKLQIALEESNRQVLDNLKEQEEKEQDRIKETIDNEIKEELDKIPIIDSPEVEPPIIEPPIVEDQEVEIPEIEQQTIESLEAK